MCERRILKKGDRDFVMFAATSGLRGRFAVMYTVEDGPIQTGLTCKNLEDTARYAISWAKEEFGVDWKDHVEDDLLRFEEDEKCSDIETTEQLVSFVKDLLKTYGITYKRLYTKPCKGSKYFCGRSLKFFKLEVTKNARSFDSCISFVVILQERLGSKFKVVPVQHAGYGQGVTYSFSIVKGE